MSLEGVWLQFVIQAKKILTEWNVGAVDKQCESENAWCNGHSTNNRPIAKIAKTNVLPPSSRCFKQKLYGNDSIDRVIHPVTLIFCNGMKYRVH